MTDRDPFTQSSTELPPPFACFSAVWEMPQGIRITLRRIPKEFSTRNLPTFLVGYEMKLARGPSEPGNCSPRGWPTAEFISVLAEKSVSNFGELLF